MKQYRTSALMRAIVADASRPGQQRYAASQVLNRGRHVTWRALYDKCPYSMATACGWSPTDPRRRLAWGDPVRVQAVHDDLVNLARHYGIQPTGDV